MYLKIIFFKDSVLKKALPRHPTFKEVGGKALWSTFAIAKKLARPSAGLLCVLLYFAPLKCS